MIYSFDSKDIDQSDIFQSIKFTCENCQPFPAVLITPICDIIIQEGRKAPKAKYFKFAGIIPAATIFSSLASQLKITKSQLSGQEYIAKETYADFIFLLKNFLTGAIYPRYYYLPPLDTYFSHSMIDFQLIETIPYSIEFMKYLSDQKIGSLKSSWRESIPVRYAAYSSRIGVQSFSDEFIDSLLVENSMFFKRSS